jgi:MFS family permease
MRGRVLVAIAGGLAGWLIGLLAAHVTGWRWWVRICVAIAPAIALLIAERKRFVRTAEELNRPVSIFSDQPPDTTRNSSSRESGNLPLR